MRQRLTMKWGLTIVPMLIMLLTSCSQTIVSSGNTLSISTGAQPMTGALVLLTHQPVGTVTLKWKSSTNLLTVSLRLTGLSPLSTHPAHIHASPTCQTTSSTSMLYTLHPVVADKFGIGLSTTQLHNVPVPRQGWVVNIHNSPSLASTAQSFPIACAVIHNYSHAFEEGSRELHYTLTATTAANQNVTGQAQLSVTHHQLSVQVRVYGLVPGSSHMEHIHLGSCTQQGPVLYMLKNLIADNHGTATATTIIANINQIPSYGWYLNVHRSVILTFPNGEMNQTNFDPISCGNIQ